MPFMMNCASDGLHSKRSVSIMAFILTDPIGSWVLNFSNKTPRNSGEPQVWHFFSNLGSGVLFSKEHQSDSTRSSLFQIFQANSAAGGDESYILSGK